MKKILFLLFPVILAMFLSSFSSPQQTEKKFSNGDSITVVTKANVNVTIPKFQKGDEPLVRKAIELMQSSIELNESKQTLLQEALMTDRVSKIEEICINLDITPDELYKKARADTTWKFISSVLITIMSILGLYIIFKLSQSTVINWQTNLTLAGVFILTILLLNEHLYSILSWLFNQDYITIKEIINQIN